MTDAADWPAVTAEDVAAILGRDVAALPVDLGSPRRTHVYVFDDVVVKFNQNDSLRVAREQAALQLLVGSGIRVPEFLAGGTLSYGRPWLVMTKLSGEHPPDALRAPHHISVELASQLGALVAQLHAGPTPPGFGTWTERNYTLFEENDMRIDGLTQMAVDARIVDDAELRDVLALLQRTRAALESASTKPVLAHRDVQPRNVLVGDDGALHALIDFDSSGGGDPTEDLRTVAFDWTTPGFAAYLNSYRDAGGLVDDGFADRLVHFVLHWALVAFAYLGNVVPSSVDDARLAIRRVKAGEKPPI